LNFGSTVPDRKYLRIVFRDSPVRRAISRIESWSRNAQRRITLNNAMSITPSTPAENSQGGFRTWVKSQRKFLALPGQLSPEINSQYFVGFFSPSGHSISSHSSGRLSVSV
jgi:hypothetical protein